MIQSAYSCVTLHVKHKKLPFLAVFPWFLILSKIQDGSQDGDHCEWRHRPPAAAPCIKYTSSCWEDQRLSAEGKIVAKYCNVTPGRGSINPPPPLYHGGGMNLRVRPRNSVSLYVGRGLGTIWDISVQYTWPTLKILRRDVFELEQTPPADVFLEKNKDFSGSHICKEALIYQQIAFFLFFFFQIIQHFFESCGFLAFHADVLTGSSRNHSWRGMPFLRDEPEASFCELNFTGNKIVG